jgi:hypothetical protein
MAVKSFMKLTPGFDRLRLLLLHLRRRLEKQSRSKNAVGWKTNLITSVFFVWTSIFLPHGTMLITLIWMFADVRLVGFHPPQKNVSGKTKIYRNF